MARRIAPPSVCARAYQRMMQLGSVDGPSSGNLQIGRVGGDDPSCIGTATHNFGPADFGPNLAEWWLASAGIGFGTGSQVASWTGQANGTVLAQSAGTQQPIHRSAASSPGGQQSLLFQEGQASSLSCALPAVISTNNISVGVVFLPTADAQDYFSLFQCTNAAGGAGYGLNGNGPMFGFFANNLANLAGNIFLTPDTLYRAIGVYDGTSVSLYLNGTLVGAQPPETGPISYASVSSTNVGASPGWGNFDGFVSEIVVVNEGIPSTGPKSVAALDGYFASKYA